MKTHILPEIQVSYQRSLTSASKITIKSSQDDFKFLMDIWDLNTIQLYEEFYVLYLARNNSLIGYRMIGRGGISATVVDPKLVLSFGLACGCSSIILTHNHPSGNLKPSKLDVDITKKIKEGAELLEIQLIDHLIVNSETWFSFADDGLL